MQLRKKPTQFGSSGPAADDEGHFEAKKEHLHEDGHGGGHGGTEMGWLVSYADMMTLLFGLFVILFSLATDKPKEMEGILKDASKKYFRSSQVEGSSPVAPAGETVKPASLDPRIAELQKVLQQEKLKYDAVKSEFALKIEAVEEEKKSLQSKVRNLERKPAAAAMTTVPSVSPEQIENKELKQQIEQVKAEVESLKSQLDTEKNKTPAQSYMMVLVSWETEKHDLDLHITTPSKKSFNFKKRKIASEPGAFVLDSRYGPGVEVWRAENFTPGRYVAKVSLYNKNGNAASPKLQLNVLTNLQSYKTSVLEIDSGKNEIEIIFDVDKEGAVQLQN